MLQVKEMCCIMCIDFFCKHLLVEFFLTAFNNKNTSHLVTCPNNISNWINLAAFPLRSFACKQSRFPVLYHMHPPVWIEKSVTPFALRVACLGKQEWGLTPVQLISATALLSGSPMGTRSEILCMHVNRLLYAVSRQRCEAACRISP